MDFNTLLSVTQQQFSVEDYVYEDYFIENYDLSLYEVQSPFISKFMSGRSKSEIRKVSTAPLSIKDVEMNSEVFQEYVKLIYEDRNKISFNPDIFITNNDNTRLATNDFRIILNEGGSKKIPLFIKHKVASICILLLIGYMDEPIAYNLIKDLVKDYCILDMTFQAKGFVYVNFLNSSINKNFKYKGLIRHGDNLSK